jgi:hypothetical protein
MANTARDLENVTQTPPSTPCVKPQKESVGEHAFNWFTYTGVGFLLNLGLSVAITDYFTHGKGKEALRWLSKQTAHGIGSAATVAPTKLENATYGFWKTNALMSGGHIVMAPIKLLEDNKSRVVHWINQKLGVDKPILKDGVEVPLSSLSDEELPPLYQDQPKQSWWNVIKRRAMGLALTSATGTMMGEKLQHKVEDTLTDKLFLPALQKSPSPALQNLASNDTFARYARLVSLDQFFTAITSAVTYLTNGSKKHEEPAQAAPSYNSTSTEAIEKHAKRNSFVDALTQQNTAPSMGMVV